MYLHKSCKRKDDTLRHVDNLNYTYSMLPNYAQRTMNRHNIQTEPPVSFMSKEELSRFLRRLRRLRTLRH